MRPAFSVGEGGRHHGDFDPVAKLIRLVFRVHPRRRGTEFPACRTHRQRFPEILRYGMFQQEPKIIIEVVVSFDEREEFGEGMAALSQCGDVGVGLRAGVVVNRFTQCARFCLALAERREVWLVAVHE